MAQDFVRVYDPEKAQVQVGGVYMTGWATDQKIELQKQADNFLAKVGVEGTVSYAINYDATAKLILHLATTSPSIPHLRALAVSRTMFNVTFTDLNDNGNNFSCDGCVVIKTPDTRRNKEVETEDYEVFIPYFEAVKDLNGGNYDL